MAQSTWKPYRPSLAPNITSLWNRCLGDQFPMTAGLFRQNSEGAPSYQPDDSTVVLKNGEVIAYILTKRFREKDALLAQLGGVGWIDAILVDPAWQRQGLGRDLLAWAIYRLRSNGASTIYLGGGFRHFLPGPPADQPGLAEFFGEAGFKTSQTVHDLRGNLRGFTAPPSATAALDAQGSQVVPCRAADLPALIDFLLAEFPGRWRFDTKRFLDLGGAPEDIMILRTGDKVIGFAQIYHAASAFWGPPTFWHPLVGEHYGGLGPIGVAASVRGKGLGLALLQLSLQNLAQQGVEDAVIDWTTLIDFYARAGFTPWKTYVRMQM